METPDINRESFFNLQDRIDSWVHDIRIDPSITESDVEELHSHLLDLIDNLKKVGLDDEEAFWVASKRLQISEDVTNEYRKSNNALIQMRRSLIILGGVLVFFLLYYFIKATSKLLFIAIFSLSDSNASIAINWFERILVSWHFVFLLFLASIFFLENKIVKLIEKIKLKPKYTIILLLISIIFELIDISTNPIIKAEIKDNLILQGKFVHANIYFGISFPLFMCIGFIFIYYKYYQKTKV